MGQANKRGSKEEREKQGITKRYEQIIAVQRYSEQHPPKYNPTMAMLMSLGIGMGVGLGLGGGLGMSPHVPRQRNFLRELADEAFSKGMTDQWVLDNMTVSTCTDPSIVQEKFSLEMLEDLQ